MKYTRCLSCFGLIAVFVIGFLSCAQAANVTLPSTTATTLTATVSEQATVSVPAAIAFTVNDVTSATTSGAGTVSITNVCITDAKSIRVALEANAVNFTAPGGGGTTWAASDVSWLDSDITALTPGGTAYSQTGLVNGTPKVLAESGANPSSFSFNFVLTLAAKPTVNRAGAHTLSASWKVTSF